MKRVIAVVLTIMAVGCKAKQSAPTADAAVNPGDLSMSSAREDLIQLVSPRPWSSLVTSPLSLNIESKASPEAVQAAVGLVSYPARSPLAATYKWSDGKEGLKALEISWGGQITGDFSLSITPSSAFSPTSSTIGFSTLANPRVNLLRAASDDGKRLTNFSVGFSELIDFASVSNDTVQFFAGSAAQVNGKFVGANAPNVGYVFFEPSDDISPTQPIRCVVSKAILASSGKSLNPQSWDATTVNAEGNFEVTLDPAKPGPDCGTGCIGWLPVIN